MWLAQIDFGGVLGGRKVDGTGRSREGVQGVRDAQIDFVSLLGERTEGLKDSE